MASRQFARVAVQSCRRALAPQARGLSTACVRNLNRTWTATAPYQRTSSILSSRTAAPSRGFAAAAADLPAHEELPMPSLSPTMEQGNIAKWKVKEGDKVGPGVILCEIETDKATLEWEAMEDGFVAKILAPDGAQNIAVGTTVAVICEEEADIPAFASFSAAAAAAPAAPVAAEPAPAAAPAAPAAAPKAAAAASSGDLSIQYINDASSLATNVAGWIPGRRTIA